MLSMFLSFFFYTFLLFLSHYTHSFFFCFKFKRILLCEALVSSFHRTQQKAIDKKIHISKQSKMHFVLSLHFSLFLFPFFFRFFFIYCEQISSAYIHKHEPKKKNKNTTNKSTRVHAHINFHIFHIHKHIHILLYFYTTIYYTHTHTHCTSLYKHGNMILKEYSFTHNEHKM